MPRSSEQWARILEDTPPDSRRRPHIERHLETAKQRESEHEAEQERTRDLPPGDLADIVRARITGTPR